MPEDALWVSGAFVFGSGLAIVPGRGVVVPEAVAEEILRGPADDPARRALEAGVDVRPAALDREVVEWSLGAGESAVLSLSKLN